MPEEPDVLSKYGTWTIIKFARPRPAKLRTRIRCNLRRYTERVADAWAVLTGKAYIGGEW